MDRKEVLDKLQSYAYHRARLREARAQYISITYKTTPTYGNLAGASGGNNSSKVEDMGNRRIDLETKIKNHNAKVEEVRRMIQKSGLDDREKRLLWWLANNGKLQVFARREHIGKDNVYKMRDRAIDKVIAAEKTRNVV